MPREATFGKCDRVMHTGRRCGRRGRYIVFETRRLCRQCYQAHLAGRPVQFDPGRAPTAAEQWAFWERLRADVLPTMRGG